jgi:hypothetical protein
LRTAIFADFRPITTLPNELSLFFYKTDSLPLALAILQPDPLVRLDRVRKTQPIGVVVHKAAAVHGGCVHFFGHFSGRLGMLKPSNF